MQYKVLSKLYYQGKELYEETYKRRINDEATYHFPFKINDDNAFVVMTHEVLQKIDEIMSFNRQLYECIQLVPEGTLKQYKRTCLIDEIQCTNEIEGIKMSRELIDEILNDKEENGQHKYFYDLVKKYESLLQNDEIKLSSCQDIRDLYNELLLRDVVAENIAHRPDGAIFRKNGVRVCGNYDKVVHEGLYPESKVIATMSEALNTLNDATYNDFIRIAVFHYMFGYIHPFYDGNGRTSRFISSYLLAQRLDVLVAYRLSATIKENIQAYYKAFKIVDDKKNRGDLTPFIITFLDIVAQSVKQILTDIKNFKTL